MSAHFVSYTEKIILSRHHTKYSKNVDSSKQLFQTFFIKNQGMSTVTAWLEVGPDGLNYIKENKFTLTPDEFIALTPKIYGKYTRVGVSCLEHTKSTIEITVQSRR